MRLGKQFLNMLQHPSLHVCSFSAVIGQELLTNTEVLLLCVQNVRTLCQRACSSNSTQDLGSTEVCLIKLDPKDTIWLADFMSNQREQCSIALEKLLKIREEIVQLAYKACMVSDMQILRRRFLQLFFR